MVRLLADDGVTYARPGRPAEPWVLDPLPLVVDAEQWRALESGLAQRAELLNAVLEDLYGERRLLADGVLPAPVVLGHTGYLRPLARPGARDPRPLVLGATDLGQDGDGGWRVLADRTQAPSGIGYAVQNRRVLTRALPDLHRGVDVHRIEPFVAALRSALLQSATGDLADPRAVVLTPGSGSETAVDQAVLADLLGFPLVQGSDLVVRDGWVCLRTSSSGRAGGGEERWQRVDVVLRRVDAVWSDPLELQGDSRLGVAGLARAVRRERVRVVNSLGAGVVENPGLAPYLPAVCERLLDEPLRLRGPDTWWCGDPAGLSHVLAHLDDLQVRAVDGPSSALAGLPTAVLRSRLAAEPHRFVGQQRLPLSEAPTWAGSGVPGDPAAGGVRSRPVTLRAFTLRYGSAYRPLAGGLGSVHEGDRVVASKDVRVLKRPGELDQGLAEVLAVATAPATPAVVPRALADLWWVGRYAERAEDLLRLVLAAQPLVDDAGDPGLDRGLDPVRQVVREALARQVGTATGAGADAGAGAGDLGLAELVRIALLDERRPGTVAQSLGGLRLALTGVREQVSGDVWRVFGTAERAANVLREAPSGYLVAESAGRMLTGVLSLQGVTASMIRDDGWHAIGLGRSLERSLQVARLLVVARERRGLDAERAVLGVVLAAAESAVTHRRRHRGHVRTVGVLDLLLLDAENPRSLACALAEADVHLRAMSGSTGSTRPERMLAELREEVGALDVRLLATAEGLDRPALGVLLDHVVAQVERVADAVAVVHLASGPAPRPFGPGT